MRYDVIFQPFTERHFIKTFSKKYRGAWDSTYKALVVEFMFFDVLLERKMADPIIDSPEITICKTEFKIAGSNESRHGSGNRCIVALHKNTRKVCVLLVYYKTDLHDGDETAKWKKLVKENYPEYKELF